MSIVVPNATTPLKLPVPMLNGRPIYSAQSVGLSLVEYTLYQGFSLKGQGSIKLEDKDCQNQRVEAIKEAYPPFTPRNSFTQAI